MAKIVSLKYFVTLGSCNSIREAAEKIAIHPNVLSRNIEHLEHYMKARLIERGPLGIRLTPAGELLAAKLERTLNDLDHVVHLIDDLKGLRRGVISIHAGEGIASGILLPVVSAFSARFRGVDFKLSVGSSKDAIRALEDASCDLVLTFFAPESDAVTVVKRTWLPQYIIARPDHPVTRAGGTELQVLPTYDWVLPPIQFGVRSSIDRISRAAGSQIIPKFEMSSLDLQKRSIIQAGAIGALPRAAVADELAAGTIVAVPFPPAMTIETSLDLCVARDRQPSFAAAAFRRELEQALQAHEGDT